RNRNPPAIPAEEVQINRIIQDAAAIQILADSLEEIFMEFPNQVHKVYVFVNHAASVAVGWNKERSGNRPEETIFTVFIVASEGYCGHGVKKNDAAARLILLKHRHTNCSRVEQPACKNPKTKIEFLKDEENRRERIFQLLEN